MPREYVIDLILPKREVHLLAGASGSGKTRLLFQWLEDWTVGKPVLGYESRPCDWLYVSADRSLAGTTATLDSLKCTLKNPTQFYSLVTGDQKKYPRSTMGLLALCKDRLPKGGIVFVDGFQSLCPGGKVNDYAIVADWMAMLTRECLRLDLTIVGLCHSGKAKKGEEYTHPRQRVMGNNAWGAYSETIIIIDTPEPEKNPNGRKLFVYPRQGAPLILTMMFTAAGRLEEGDDSDLGEMILSAFINTLGPGEEFSTKQAYEFCTVQGASRPTVFRHLAKAAAKGLIQKTGHGVYTVTFKQ